MLIFFLGIVEGLRRIQWVLIRVENENINNFEKYRNIIHIPKIREDVERQSNKKDK